MYSAILLLTVSVIVCFTQAAEAWGPGMHIAQGTFILDNLNLIRPQIASLLAAYPLDYLYGCISADIFLGKGYRRRDDHCHNWSVGKKVLNSARSDVTKSYAYGYNTHLAADVIAHNHLIPNLLYSTPTGKRLGHVYWEFRADRFIEKRHWKKASEVVMRHNHDTDNLIKDVMNRSNIRFGAKKMIYKRAVRASDLSAWRQQVEVAGNQNRIFTKNEIATLNNYAINLIIDLLKNRDDAVCFMYDPVGTDNTIAAKKIRKSDKQKNKHDKNHAAFPVPGNIIAVDYIDVDTIRF